MSSTDGPKKMTDAQRQEFDDLFSKVSEVSVTHGVDSPLYAALHARLLAMQDEFGMIEEPDMDSMD